jgi:hypothetical protein
MSSDIKHLLEHAAHTTRPLPGFDDAWKRSRGLLRKRVAAGATSFLAGVVVVALLAGPVLETDVRTAPHPPAGQGRAEPPVLSGTWRRLPDAPINPARYDFVTVWTGTEVVYWGGREDVPDEQDNLLDGAAYDPVRDRWREVSPAPFTTSDARAAVWTGKEMIVWGGEEGDGSHERPDNGAAYDPDSDTWRELSRAPTWSLASHSAIWTGEEMLVAGGVLMEDEGAAYLPGEDRWRKLPQPPLWRFGHAAVWTGEEMILWGGRDAGDNRDLGAAYDPATNSWRELPKAPIPSADSPRSVWTGNEMIVWGGWAGRSNSVAGAAYDPATDSWRKIADAPHPSAWWTPASWTGEHMIVQAAMSNRLMAYSPDEDEWAMLPVSPKGTGMEAWLTWTRDELIVWGGFDPDSGGKPSGAAFTFD